MTQFNSANIQPHATQYRPLLWDDSVYDLQDTLLALDIPEVYIVGGAVRDAYLHRPIKDIDIATPFQQAIPLARQLTNALNGDIYVMDKERDVARVFIQTDQGKMTIDFAGFRGANLAEDLLDRDFTMNAMAVALHGDLLQIIDPHNGEQDLFDKVLRQCHERSMQDDPVRVLRAVRQSAQFSLRIAPDTLVSIRQAIADLSQVSAERIRDEFFNILHLPRPLIAFRVMKALNLFNFVMPSWASSLSDADWQASLLATEKLEAIITAISPRRNDNLVAIFDLGMLVMQIDRYRTSLQQHFNQTYAHQRLQSGLLLLGMLLYHRAQDVDFSALGEDLRLSTQEVQTLKHMLNHVSQAQSLLQQETLDDLQLHRYWRPVQQTGIDSLLMAMAGYLAQAGTALEQHTWLHYVEHAQQILDAYFNAYERLVAPPALVDGNQLMQEFNLKGSPLIGHLLTAICEAQVTGDVTNEQEALQLAERFIRKQS
jgi:poly(A) polymerase